MSKVMALDIETANYSHEIGGWDKTHLFEPTVVATWDGEEAHAFTKSSVKIEGAHMHPLHPRDLGDHLKKHVREGGIIVGHNIKGFDLPVLRDALDMYFLNNNYSKINFEFFHNEFYIFTANSM